MREIVLDTETTGFDPDSGDRIVEIGCVELINHLPTKRHFHVYINPERSMPEGAFAVHGLGDDFLRDKPVFRTIAADFLEFIQDDPLVIHNAAFDMKFLNFELLNSGFDELTRNPVIDTLTIARQKYPGAQASLDALCRRYGIDNTERTLHGALLDSEILAEVYLELIGGRQPDFILDNRDSEAIAHQINALNAPARARPTPLSYVAVEAELQAHTAFVETLDNPIWKRL